MREENRLKQEKTESAHLASTSKDISKKRNKGKEAAGALYVSFVVRVRNNKSDWMRTLPISFVVRVDTRRRIVSSITLGM